MKNSILKMRALEIRDEIVDATLAAGPEGLSFVAGAAIADMEYNEFYGAAHELSHLGFIKIGRGRNGHRNRIIALDAIEPVELALSDGQRRVLNYLHSIADENGCAQASFRDIARGAGIKSPSFCVDRLDIKGYLDFIDLGSPKNARRYRVYPDGSGKKSDTWWLLKYGRVPAWEWAEAQGYI